MADTFTKHGLTHGDHHFKDSSGKEQATPPKELKTLYDYLPSSDGGHHDAKQIPMKLAITSEVNALKGQARCLGVYTLVSGKRHNEQPMWRHSTEDLVVALAKDASKDCWMVARSVTIDNKEDRCMKIESRPMPWSNKSASWQEWDGRNWSPAPTVKCRPSYHGWGHDGGDGWQHSKETSFHDGCVNSRRGRTHDNEAGLIPMSKRSPSPKREL